MTVKVAFQMDSLEKLNFATDSSIMLIQEGFVKGYDIYIFTPDSLSLVDNKVIAKAKKVKSLHSSEKSSLGKQPIIMDEKETHIELEKFSVVWIRQDPPFDMQYITNTFILEKLSENVKVINHPTSVRNAPEKIVVTNFSHHMPKTAITRDLSVISDFLEEFGKCIIKPLYGNGGEDIFLLEKSGINNDSIIEYFLKKSNEPFIVQEFLAKVEEGDKRIIFIDGEVKGIFTRVPKKDNIKSNVAQGATVVKSDLTDKEKQICKELSVVFKEQGLFFVGIDVIDEKITEINVTSPTGLRVIESLYGENLAKVIWNILI